MSNAPYWMKRKPRESAPSIDTTVAHSARVWNYWLGGKDHFAADRVVGDRVRQVYPGVVDEARQARAFLRRAVRFLVSKAGVDQFLDIGTGLPAAENTHETAQRVEPTCRVVYVDNDPLVLSHARALLISGPEGAAALVDGDLRSPDKIIHQAAETLDLSRPVGVILLGVVGHIGDDDEARSLVGHLMETFAPGSYLVLGEGSAPSNQMAEVYRRYNRGGAEPYFPRTPEQIVRFFAGLDLLPPGVVPTPRWRPDSGEAASPEVLIHCGVARKPGPKFPT